MGRQTIALHGGYALDPVTCAVAVPIYQTVAYAFDSVEHGAALFNLEVVGHRSGRIGNPTNDVLERGVAALECGAGTPSVSTGQAALHSAILNVTGNGRNIVSVLQLYGAIHTLFAHILAQLVVRVRFADNDQPAAPERLIDRETCALFCEGVGSHRTTAVH